MNKAQNDIDFILKRDIEEISVFQIGNSVFTTLINIRGMRNNGHFSSSYTSITSQDEIGYSLFLYNKAKSVFQFDSFLINCYSFAE